MWIIRGIEIPQSPDAPPPAWAGLGKWHLHNIVSQPVMSLQTKQLVLHLIGQADEPPPPHQNTTNRCTTVSAHNKYSNVMFRTCTLSHY